MGVVSKGVLQRFLKATKNGGAIDDLLGAVSRPRARVMSAVAAAPKHVQSAIPSPHPRMKRMPITERNWSITGTIEGSRESAVAAGNEISSLFKNGAFFDLGSTRKAESVINRTVR